MNRLKMIDMQYNPKHLIEKFSEILGEVYPNVYKNELPEDLYDMAMGMSESATCEDKDIGRIVADLRKCKARVKYHEYMVHMLNTLHDRVLKNKFDVNGSAVSSKKGPSFFDAAYLGGVELPELAIQLEEAIISMPEITHHLIEISWDFNNSGNKVFRLSDRLTQELLHTEIKKINAEFLELPFQAICFHVPHNDTLTIRGAKIKWYFIGEYAEEGTCRVFKMLLVDEEEIPTVVEYEFKGGDIFPQIKTQVTERFKSKLAAAENLAVMEFFAAVVLYMNSKELHQSPVPTPPHTPMSRKTKSKYPVCMLGMDIQISKKYQQIPVGKTDNEEAKTINILKWMVRGHFRNQAVGFKRSERKLIWIRPFMKGKERDNHEINTKPSNYILK